MSEQSKDELARFLSAMAEGQHPDQQDEEEDADETDSAPVASAQQPSSIVRPATPSHTAPEPTPITPAPPHPQPRPLLRPRTSQHLVQTLFFKRTIIPILLTLGVLCPFLGLLGYFVSPTSPYARLAEPWFSIPFIVIGLIMLGLAILTMLQVRDDLSRK